MQSLGNANGSDSAKVYLTIPEAATALGVSPDTVRRRIKSGELPADLFAKKYRLHRDDLERLIRRVA
jgi:excisionase family DNA binding protein